MSVVHAMLGNAAVAVGLALIALAVGRFGGSPAVRHAAWVLVLLKLVAPPLFTVSLPVLPASWGNSNIEIRNPKQSEANLKTAGNVEREKSADGFAFLSSFGLGSDCFGFRDSVFGRYLLTLWVGGAIGWLGWQGRRIVRFRRRVRAAEAAPPEVVEAAARLAAALGIDAVPAVKVTTGLGSPMLWGWGRGAVVLFPRELLARLAPEARDTLLAHELAHFLRRDHWVRVLEYVAGGLYWWHPAVWLARGGIEAAEEECCDAWVVGGLSASPRRYAEALLATVDFDAELRRPCLPPGACAASRGAKLLHRRLVRILHADRPRRLPGGAISRVVVLAALCTQPVLSAAKPETVPVMPMPEPVGVSSPSWNPTPKTSPNPPVKEPRSWATTTAPDGELIVLARDREVLLRRTDGTERALGPGRPLALAFEPGGRRLATAGPGPLVRTWDRHGQLLATTHAAAAVRSVAYTPDGTALLALDAAGGVTVRDPDTLAVVNSWSVEGPANSLACAPDGRTVAVSFGSWRADDGWVECRSIADGKPLARYAADAPVGAARFSPDGVVLVLGGWDGRVFWRLLPSGSLLAERQLAKDLVATAAFSPDAGTLPLDPPPEPAPPPAPVGVFSPLDAPIVIRPPVSR